MTRFKSFVIGVCTLGAAVLTAQAAITDITPGGAVPFDGSLYKVFTAPSISWGDAETYISANLPGWHLATVTSGIENAFIWGVIEGAWVSAGNMPPPGQYWLGGYQDPPTVWHWVTGEAWSYTNWAPGEPNGDLGGNGHLTVGRYGDWKWNDEGAAPSLITGFVVETAVPEPSTCVAGILLILPLILQSVRSLRKH